MAEPATPGPSTATPTATPIPQPWYRDFPGRDLPTSGLPDEDTNEAGDVLAADPAGILSYVVPPIDPNTELVSLLNTGNDCFRNSVFHCLFSLDHFVRLLESGESMTDRALYKLLRKLALLFRSGDSTVNNANTVKPVWDLICKTGGNNTSPAATDMDNLGMEPWGQSGRQEDASSFLEYLLARLCSTEITADIYNLCNPQYRRMFAWEQATRAVYDCDCVQKARLPIQNPDLSVRSTAWTSARYAFHVERNPGIGVESLSDAISTAMSTYIEPPGVDICSNCLAGQISGLFWKFFYLPEILPIAVQYQRTAINTKGETTGRKLDTESKIDLPEIIDLSRLCERPADANNAKYRLMALILWRGADVGGTTVGHYISYIRRNGDAWNRIDDMGSPPVRACKDGLNDARNEPGFQPRVLFYEKIHPPPPPPKTPSAQKPKDESGNEDGDKDDKKGGVKPAPQDNGPPPPPPPPPPPRPKTEIPGAWEGSTVVSTGRRTANKAHRLRPSAEPVPEVLPSSGRRSRAPRSQAGGSAPTRSVDWRASSIFDRFQEPATTFPPPPDASFEPLTVYYRVIYVPDSDTPVAGNFGPSPAVVGSEENRNDEGQEQDPPASGGDQPAEEEAEAGNDEGQAEEEGDESDSGEGSSSGLQPILYLRGGASSAGGGSQSSSRNPSPSPSGAGSSTDSSQGQAADPYADFENWGPAQEARFKAAFRDLGLVRPGGKGWEAWKDILRSIRNPDEPVNYNYYTIETLRTECKNRGLDVRGIKKKTFVDALEEDDERQKQADAKKKRKDAKKKKAAEDDEKKKKATDDEKNKKGNEPVSAVNDTPEAAGQTQNDDPDAPDPVLEERLHDLEELIADLENTDAPCNCPLNGQVVAVSTPQGSNNNSGSGSRGSGGSNNTNNSSGSSKASGGSSNNDGGQARRGTRGLHLQIDLTSEETGLSAGQPEFWFKVPPQFDIRGLEFRVNIQISPPNRKGLYPWRLSFWGPQPRDRNTPILDRDAPINKSVQFLIPFFIPNDKVRWEIKLEPFPDVPLMDASSKNLSFRALQEAPATRTEEWLRRPPEGVPRPGPQRTEQPSPTPQGRGVRRTASQASLGGDDRSPQRARSS